jgi:hypothetical protein
MTDYDCTACEEPIEGDIVWWNPLAGETPGSANGGQPEKLGKVASANPQSAHDSPYHPKCFEQASGHKWLGLR